MAFPQPSNLTNPNTAPLPSPPPRPERNRRGLRADSQAPLYRSNVSTYHGQITLLPPPNMVRVRAGRSDNSTSASSSRSVLEGVNDQASAEAGPGPSSAAQPRRKKKRQPDGREEIQLKPLQTASEAIRERYRRSEAAMRAPPPPPPPTPPSALSPSTGEVRRIRRNRAGMDLGRGASMRRRNVQEGVYFPLASLKGKEMSRADRPSSPLVLQTSLRRFPSKRSLRISHQHSLRPAINSIAPLLSSSEEEHHQNPLPRTPPIPPLPIRLPPTLLVPPLPPHPLLDQMYRQLLLHHRHLPPTSPILRFNLRRPSSIPPFHQLSRLPLLPSRSRSLVGSGTRCAGRESSLERDFGG